MNDSKNTTNQKRDFAEKDSAITKKPKDALTTMTSKASPAKLLMTVLLLASVALNVFLLIGCTTASASRWNAPSEMLSSTDVDEMSKNLTDDKKNAFYAIVNWVDNCRGRTIFVLDEMEPEKEEKIRNKKRILLYRTDIQELEVVK